MKLAIIGRWVAGIAMLLSQLTPLIVAASPVLVGGDTTVAKYAEAYGAITYTPHLGIISPPLNFTAEIVKHNGGGEGLFGSPPITGYANGDDIVLTWEMGEGAIATIIIRQADIAPVDINDGQVVFNGIGVSFTDVGAANESVEYFYAAWGTDGVNYSSEPSIVSAGGWGMTLIANYLLLILFLVVAVVLTAVSETKDNNVLGMLAAIFWVVDGAYCYFLRGLATPPLDTLFQVLGIVGMLGGITFGLSNVLSMQRESSEKRKQADAENATESFDEHLRKVRSSRKKISQKKQEEVTARKLDKW